MSKFLKSGAEGLAAGGIPIKGANKAELPGTAVSKLGDLGPTTLNAGEIRFSRRSVTGLQSRIDTMAEHGWAKFDPADVVKMPDGGYTTLDNRRVLAAGYADNPVQANLHHHSDSILDAEVANPFPASRGPNKGAPAATWGEAVENRINNQGATFRNTYPQGSPVTGWAGD